MEAVSLKVSWEDNLRLSEDEKENVLPRAGDLPTCMDSPRIPLQAAESKPKMESIVVVPKDCGAGLRL